MQYVSIVIQKLNTQLIGANGTKIQTHSDAEIVFKKSQLKKAYIILIFKIVFCQRVLLKELLLKIQETIFNQKILTKFKIQTDSAVMGVELVHKKLEKQDTFVLDVVQIQIILSITLTFVKVVFRNTFQEINKFNKSF